MELSDYVSEKIYTPGLFTYVRRKSREVQIGDIALGGNNPVRIQSMTTTDTMDTAATIAQSIRIIEAGSDYVRITAPSLKEAENLRYIKEGLRKAGYQTPLIADIHFTPNAAEMAARIVEKVRINPGNYVDKKKFEQRDYTDAAYESEIERIRKRFEPLVKICKEYGTAMRIGTNHGSLSDRIMNRYGDTPLGMVESAMEFLRICESLDYFSVVLSMKSSNPLVMVDAYRLLVARMDAEGMNYPLHLGVTEAGEGEEGRIKSAMGIGALLADGLGDTVRVSLTEEPEVEIPVAKELADRYMALWASNAENSEIAETVETVEIPQNFNPYSHNRRATTSVINFGDIHPPRVIADFSDVVGLQMEDLKPAGYIYNPIPDKWHTTDQGADYIYLGNTLASFMLPNGLKAIYDYDTWAKSEDKRFSYPLIPIEKYIEGLRSPGINFIHLQGDISDEYLEKLKHDKTVVLITEAGTDKITRKLFYRLLAHDIKVPVVFKMNPESLIGAAADSGFLFTDGFGDGLMLNFGKEKALANRTAFSILQAARLRISKTEYISCPSCGRTLFNLQETTAMIRKETDHLKGVKIAIMGCIVNGPGEMADADYGYVGTGPGKITLYRGKEIIKRNINSEEALGELINLIRGDGLWIDNKSINAVSLI